MAVRFEHVCGHKGYSLDIFQAMERYKRIKQAKGITSNVHWTKIPVQDSISKLAGLSGFSRLRVPPGIMDEIGFEDCDWISHEVDAKWWKRFEGWPLPLELHIPCRDPIEHLLSQCNYLGKMPDCCQGVKGFINSCLRAMNRFSTQLEHHKNIK
eukprot:758811-Hanusia_phi.AAC.1